MVSLKDLLNMDQPRISDFFKDKSIFITGGTGFMGKVLLEKLLRSCSGLDKIYLLMRPKKGFKAEERLVQMYKSPVFERLKTEKPGFYKSKICAVSGDVMELGLGLSKADRALLVSKVRVIFHVAASVRFDDSLRYAVLMNLRGTREVLELAKELKDLSALVHVSTSYSNTNRNPVEEIIYPPHADWRETIRIAETVDDYTLRMLTPKYLGELPNTYSFTKQLAEHVMYEQRGKMPIVIFRPSIVVSSVSEPMPGWVENFSGPMGMFVASGKGIMRSMYVDPSVTLDYVFVDFAIKAMIISAWKQSLQRVTTTLDIPVYNCCSGKLMHKTMQEVKDIGLDINYNIPLNNALWAPGSSFTSNWTWHYIKVIFLHLLPAVIVDLILKGLGQKPMLVKLQRKVYIANVALDHYVTNQWSFNNELFYNLRKDILPEDQADFDFDIESVDVYDYFQHSTLGARRYLLNEPDDTLPKALVHNRRLHFIDKFSKSILVGLLVYWALQYSSYFSDFLYTILNILS